MRFLMVFLLLAVCGTAHGSLRFGVETRLRYEHQGGFNQKFYGPKPPMGKGDDGFLLGRFRFGWDWKSGRKLHVKLWFQDAESWDMGLPDDAFYNPKLRTHHNPNKDRWELSDSFVEFKRPLGLPMKITAGRQRLTYGNKRVFGPGAWGNSGRWIWDALRVRFFKGSSFIDVYAGKTMVHEPERFSLWHRHFYTSVGAYGHLEYKSIVFEPFAMTKKDNHNRYKSEDGSLGDLDSYYIGARIAAKDVKGFSLDFTYIRQMGELGNDDIKAYGMHAYLGYSFKHLPWRPSLSLEYSFASGDSNPKDGDIETFDGAFGARDKMYGRMNLFHWKNLEDYQANLELFPSKKLYVKAEFHQFYLDEEKDAWYLNPKVYRDKTGSSGRHVGSEFDIVVKAKTKRMGEVQIGYGHFFPGRFCKNLASDNEANWFFIQWKKSFSKRVF